MSRALPALALAGLLSPSALAQEWTQYGCDARHSSLSTLSTVHLSPRWMLQQHAGHSIAFPNPGGVVASAGSVYAIGTLDNSDVLIAAVASTGAVRWTAPVPAPTFGSNSSPAVDAANGVVLVAAGTAMKAYRISDGSVAWTASLQADVVNASPCMTTDRGPADRALITDFDFTGSARLYCINIDPFDATANPHQPGDVLWSIVIGSASGNTPAYDGSRIFVSCAELAPGGPGAVLCYAMGDTAPVAPLWTTPCPAGQSYYSGLSIRPAPSAGTVYAASYGFVGGQLAGDLAAINATSGAVVWHAPCNRTDSTPIPLSDGRVLLSGGLEGFGSVPSIELFSPTGTLLWDTALATWHDDNTNGQIDPGEYLRLGGWLHQPAVCPAAGLAIVGDPGATLPDKLCTISLSASPQDPGFIAASAPGSGGTPAAALIDGAPFVFTAGAAGLMALGPCYANCDGSTTGPVLNVLDFGCFLNRFAAGDPYANCDGSTTSPVLNVLDFGCFLNRFAAGCP